MEIVAPVHSAAVGAVCLADEGDACNAGRLQMKGLAVVLHFAEQTAAVSVLNGQTGNAHHGVGIGYTFS